MWPNVYCQPLWCAFMSYFFICDGIFFPVLVDKRHNIKYDEDVQLFWTKAIWTPVSPAAWFVPGLFISKCSEISWCFRQYWANSSGKDLSCFHSLKQLLGTMHVHKEKVFPVYCGRIWQQLLEFEKSSVSQVCCPISQPNHSRSYGWLGANPCSHN